MGLRFLTGCGLSRRARIHPVVYPTDRYLNEQVALKQKAGTSRGLYEFSELNSYVGHPNPLKEGQELFCKGLLSEAVLALEAEVLKNADNAEGWRLLGIAHAENDDDQQAIAAMMRAHEVDPTTSGKVAGGPDLRVPATSHATGVWLGATNLYAANEALGDTAVKVSAIFGPTGPWLGAPKLAGV